MSPGHSWVRLVFAGLWLITITPLNAQPELRWVADKSESGRVSVEASGFSQAELEVLRKWEMNTAHWERLLCVRVLPEVSAQTLKDQPAMLGRWHWQADTLCFTPRFPLETGVRYQAELSLAAMLGGDSQAARLTVCHQVSASSNQPSTRILTVHPSSPKLPENLLKIYLHFSAPMSRGLVHQHTRLLDAGGRAVELAFLELDEELWSPDQTRLTLLLDPGRIKRGLLPLEEEGPALLEGQTYVIEVDSDWVDAKGQKMAERFHHTFHVGAVDTRPPDPARWQVEPPAAGTRAALVLRFDEPMDHALSSRLIKVESESGRRVAGQIELTEHDQQWSFLPDEPWQSTPHRILIDTLIEDLAGNQIGRVFDVDTFDEVLLPQSTHAALGFTPRSPSQK